MRDDFPKLAETFREIDFGRFGKDQLATGRVRPTGGQVDLTKDFADRFASELSSKCDCKPLDQNLITRAQEIADEKYATQIWLRKR